MGKSSQSVISLVMGALILGVAYFGAYSQWGKLGEVRAQVEMSKATNADLKQAESDASAFLAKYENNLQEADMANRALPMDSADIPSLLDGLSKMVTESGLSMKEMNVVDNSLGDTAPEEYSVVPIDFNVQMSGTYEAFSNFVLRAQRNLRLIDLVSLTISESQEEEGSNVLSFSLRIRAYYQK